jgi:hypothetical protein
MQWYGSNTNIEEPEYRLRRQDWLPGWYQPDTRFYWRQSRMHSAHFEFTNVHTGHDIALTEILLTDLKLRKDNKLLSHMVDNAVRAWHDWMDAAQEKRTQ